MGGLGSRAQTAGTQGSSRRPLSPGPALITVNFGNQAVLPDNEVPGSRLPTDFFKFIRNDLSTFLSEPSTMLPGSQSLVLQESSVLEESTILGGLQEASQELRDCPLEAPAAAKQALADVYTRCVRAAVSA